MDTLEQADQVLVVAAAAIRPDDRGEGLQALCAQRAYPQNLAGKWEFPGGKLRPGESVGEALGREIFEELGTHLRVIAPLARPADSGEMVQIGGVELPRAQLWPLGEKLVMAVYVVELEGEPKAAPTADHTELRWVDAKDLQTLDWLAGDIPIAARLREVLEG